MFLKPKTSQLNGDALLYKRCIDITNYANADALYKTLSTDGTYKYWYYDKNANEMVEIQEPENHINHNIQDISSETVYMFGNKYSMSYVNGKWEYAITNISNVKWDYYFFWNYDNLIDSNKNWLASKVNEYYNLLTQYLTDNYPDFNSGDEYDITFNFNVSGNNFYIAINYEPSIYTTFGNTYNAGDWEYVENNTSLNGKTVHLSSVEINYNLTGSPTTIIDTTFYKTLPNYEKFWALQINKAVVRPYQEILNVGGINKQQRSYFLNDGYFNFAYMGDINRVEQQVIKGLNVEYITFDVKTDTDKKITEEDVVQIETELYMVSNVSYKTIRLPKPMRYQRFTLTQLKK